MRSLSLLLLLIIQPALACLHAATIRGKVTSDDFPSGAPGVNVVVYQDTTATHWGAATDSSGQYSVPSLPAGFYQLHFNYLGYQPQINSVILQENSDTILNVKLTPQALTTPELTVTTSLARHEVAITSTPLRVEVMVPEELQDKIAFSAGVNGALRYSGGVYLNPSRSLYEAETVRLRGLDSRYLLLSANQIPILGFQPEEVGIWTLPLVAVKQLEIAKGDLSALYGEASGGVIDAVLRTPFSDTLQIFDLARTNFEDDHYAALYAGKKWSAYGVSGVLTGEHLNQGDSLVDRYVFVPRFDYQSGPLKAFATVSVLGAHDKGNRVLFERQGVSVGVDYSLAHHSRVQIQAQYANQHHGYRPDPHEIKARTRLGYGAVQFLHESETLTSLAGVNVYSEDWNGSGLAWSGNSQVVRSAAFAQEEWKLNSHWSLLYGGRITQIKQHAEGPIAYSDSSNIPLFSNLTTNRWGTHQLLALLWKPNYLLNFRLSAAYGTIPPQSHYLINLEDTPQFFVPVVKLNLERFRSASFDVKYYRRLLGVGWTGNVSFFATDQQNHTDVYRSLDSGGEPQSRLETRSEYTLPGVELFSRLDLGDDAALLLGYTYLNPSRAYETDPGTMLPLPRHQGNFELDWEIESTGLRFEIEGKVLGLQNTPGNPYRTQAPAYAVWGTTLEYTLRSVRIFGGVENLSDFRQTDPGPLWGPRVGREIYVGVKGGW
jgi:hypothetical protein